MTELQRANTYTIPTTWLSPHVNYEAEVPYRRIVGLKLEADENIRWAASHHAQPVYNPVDAIEDPIELPLASVVRFSEFFRRFFEQRTEQKINCHRFGAWMDGRPLGAEESVPWYPEQFVRLGK